jgi:hypothetical protein
VVRRAEPLERVRAARVGVKPVGGGHLEVGVLGQKIDATKVEQKKKLYPENKTNFSFHVVCCDIKL